MSNDDILDKLERLLLIHERTQAMELKKAEIAAQTASRVLAENRKAQMELITYFSQFANLAAPVKKDEDT
jgi:hypothetical protein